MPLTCGEVVPGSLRLVPRLVPGILTWMKMARSVKPKQRLLKGREIVVPLVALGAFAAIRPIPGFDGGVLIEEDADVSDLRVVDLHQQVDRSKDR